MSWHLANIMRSSGGAKRRPRRCTYLIIVPEEVGIITIHSSPMSPQTISTCLRCPQRFIFLVRRASDPSDRSNFCYTRQLSIRFRTFVSYADFTWTCLLTQHLHCISSAQRISWSRSDELPPAMRKKNTVTSICRLAPQIVSL